jgi:hypothetical protein
MDAALIDLYSMVSNLFYAKKMNKYNCFSAIAMLSHGGCLFEGTRHLGSIINDIFIM